MTTLQLPDSFKRSYENYESYPHNLVCQTSYRATLEGYRCRLNDAANKLFTSRHDEVHLPFRDLLSDGSAFERQNILGELELKEWLGDRSSIDPLTSARVGELATKKDPKCRFIFIWAGHSRKPLKITQQMLTRIMSYHQVMPGYLDFISVFGSQTEPRDLRFSGFREQTLLIGPSGGPAVHDLGRSGRYFQLCYNLKCVACISDKYTAKRKKEWSIRQAAFHHQFDVEEGTTLWMITKGDLDLKSRVQDMTGKDGRPEDRAFGTPEECFKSSLAVHLLYSHWSTEDWRWYIQWLEDVVDEQTKIAVQGPRDLTQARRDYTPGDLQNVQNYQDNTNEAVMILEANVDVLTSLCDFYEGLMKNTNFPFRTICREDIAAFSAQINDIVYNTKTQVSRAKLLVQIISDRKTLILQHLQSQATEKMESLTLSMHKIGLMSQREAVAMRIITVVTLVYLPATFVSTFFSTDVVHYQSQSPDGSFSQTAMLRWIQVTFPLTALTLGMGYLSFKIADRRRERDEFAFHPMDGKACLA